MEWFSILYYHEFQQFLVTFCNFFFEYYKFFSSFFLDFFSPSCQVTSSRVKWYLLEQSIVFSILSLQFRWKLNFFQNIWELLSLFSSTINFFLFLDFFSPSCQVTSSRVKWYLLGQSIVFSILSLQFRWKLKFFQNIWKLLSMYLNYQSVCFN